MIDKLDTTLKNELIAAFEFNSEYFYKNNSSLIGIYVAKDSIIKVEEDDESEWIEIIPKSKSEKFKSIFYTEKDGYVFENRYFIKENQIKMDDFMNKKKN